MIQINQQTPEKPISFPEGSLDVFKIFPTIQGEGPFTGYPSVFVRLAGCNLQCPACDTDYTSFRRLMTPSEIISRINQFRSNETRLVVITGGEPFRQELLPFVKQALHLGLKVQIETNGTLFQDLPIVNDLSIVCSPKTPALNNKIIYRVEAFKYILDRDHVDPWDGLPTSTMGFTTKIARPPDGFKTHNIFVQPLDEQDDIKNKLNTEATIKSCMRYGYRLSFQIHKHLGLE